jgi:hypothetical protein
MPDREVDSVLRRPDLIDPDSPEAQMALPLIGTPHDHPGPAGIDRHTLLFARGGAMFYVCPRDCPDRSRTAERTH